MTVLPGAIHARRKGDLVEVRSPVPRERAFVTLVTESYRFFGASLVLRPDAEGGASASFPAPALPGRPVWAVVSSAVDLESPARVGWPLAGQTDAAPRTFDVPERLLLDGLPLAERRELARQRRVRFSVVALCAVALLLELLLIGGASSRAEGELERHFEKSGFSTAARTRLRSRAASFVAIAVLLVALAFGALALFAFLAEP